MTGAWWDYVDSLASHRVGGLLRDHPAAIRPKMLAWSRDRDMWKRRTSIICQLRFKENTDLELLQACIEPSLDSKQFFLRKAHRMGAAAVRVGRSRLGGVLCFCPRGGAEPAQSPRGAQERDQEARFVTIWPL